MPDFREYEDVVFIAGQTFQSEFGVHVAGTEVEEAKEFQNLQVLVDNNFLYPIAPEEGYAYLPPHLFAYIDVKEATMAKLKGALNPNPDHFQDGKKPESYLLAEREARQKLTEMSGDTKEAREAAKEARKSAKVQYQQMQTVDANPAVQQKASDVTKNYKGDKAAWELLEEQGNATQEAKQAKPMDDDELPVNLREDSKKKEEKLPDEENPDLAASKEPVVDTDSPADPVGEQPANSAEGGSRPANKAAAAKKSSSKK